MSGEGVRICHVGVRMDGVRGIKACWGETLVVMDHLTQCHLFVYYSHRRPATFELSGILLTS